jgi:hypothetical protein
MRPTPDHRAVERVLEQNILLQNMFCIMTVLVPRNDPPGPCPKSLYIVAER